ncbi:hypothetical protein A1359_11790 [Methylomonas lenta]|uniref:Flagellar assembly protein T middle domain-containing protein n=1 Tax=Methylomonas lenta TaxID=980561 RepID=A0A177N8V0_9GAMM|nr:flagella assembly protein FlgT middle domain-containing protein [Methylomonas lenta]OAI13619.1 hypothetical protein A1359_11790 [Methylomonas lenta]
MPYKNGLWLLLIGLLSACANTDSVNPSAISSRQTTVQGSAPIATEGVDRARQMAIDDAIANASLQLKSSNSGPIQIGDIKVVDEWQDGNTYYVQVLTVRSEQKSCLSNYRKKIVATGFPLMTSGQISGSESQDLFSGIPREISNQLMETGDFIARNMTSTVLYSRPDLAPEITAINGYSGSMLLDIAKRGDAQLVLSGVIRDFTIESTEYVRGSGVLAQLKSSMRDFIARRSIGIDVYVYDGFTGALIFQQRYTDSILGDVSLPSGYNVGSERFESSSAGHAISQIIHQASDDIQQLFSCHPFAARVVKVDNNRIVIAAGAQDKVRVGDQFMVYSAGSAGMGFTDSIGVLVVSEVGPSMSSGNLQDLTGQSRVRAGDWVRSFSVTNSRLPGG